MNPNVDYSVLASTTNNQQFQSLISSMNDTVSYLHSNTYISLPTISGQFVNYWLFGSLCVKLLTLLYTIIIYTPSSYIYPSISIGMFPDHSVHFQEPFWVEFSIFMFILLCAPISTSNTMLFPLHSGQLLRRHAILLESFKYF